MQRLYDFIRRHPTGVDSFWAVLFFGISMMNVAGVEGQSTALRLATVPVVAALTAALALRRRWTVPMFWLTAGAGVCQLAIGQEIQFCDVAMLVVLFTVAAADVPRWVSRVALAGGLLASPLYFLRFGVDKSASGPEEFLFVLFMMVPFALAWVTGDSLRTRRAYYAQLVERNQRLEKEREAQAKVAVAAERARIARELHDVVAHNVSVMVVQADGAAYVMDVAPDQAKEALQTISGTGRQALAEMRRLLGVLRTGEPQESEDYVPQPDVEQIEVLVEQVRAAGLTVDFEVEGAPRRLPSGVELTAYRIVQEALTNTRKHGGPDARASVRLVYFDDGLGLLVEDDGRGAAHELYEDGGADGAGHGLIGMRERIGMVGGTLDAGPRPGGGFRISALLPLKKS
ncbi:MULTISPECIES: sensor histidine kinase [Streptomyces]|uniref:sensor histidine kinase n=1 Tax=Streptomyces TaxID=1883 RepID=UPI000F797CB2|nr:MULTISPECIES: sensor histidine kinase [Streptomyces]RST00012.1 sensor histidine kinase [Streptomyces sp. WAC07149]GLX20574.1 two-component sensor histidine kinase [Streptomyces lavendulae subsp. lavendulae]GLX28264.1 two-component sensor histidine kinase [Streptomyces lavendulae subsp. lavendulae]